MTRGRTNPDRDRANATPRKPKPPAHLTDAESAIWTKVCKDQSGEWCEVAAAGALLEMYCVALAFYRALTAAKQAEMADATAPAAALTAARKWNESIKDQALHVAVLETKLRLTPQSRQRSDTPQGAGPRMPWDDQPPGGGDDGGEGTE